MVLIGCSEKLYWGVGHFAQPPNILALPDLKGFGKQKEI